MPTLPLSEKLVAARTPGEVAGLIHAMLSQSEPERLLEEGFRKRADILAKAATPTQSAVWSPPHRGYFHHDSTIQASMFADPLRLNDSDICDYLVKAILTLADAKTSPESLRGALLNIALWANYYYFGSFRASEAGPREREIFLGDFGQTIPMQELRGKRFAMCAERAPLFANFSALLGYDVLTAIAECRLNETSSGLHVYNVARRANDVVILDPTNPVVWRYQNGARSFSLAFYPLDQNQKIAFCDGAPVEVDHHDMQEHDSDSFRPSEPVRRRYKAPDSGRDSLKEFCFGS